MTPFLTVMQTLLSLLMTYSWYFNTHSPAALLVVAAAVTGMPMSMLFKEKFHALTGKQFVTEVHDGIFRYLLRTGTADCLLSW